MPEPGEDRLDALRPGEAGYDPAAPEEHQFRYAPHAEPRRKNLILLGVDLDNRRFSRQLLRYCPHRRCE